MVVCYCRLGFKLLLVRHGKRANEEVILDVLGLLRVSNSFEGRCSIKFPTGERPKSYLASRMVVVLSLIHI